MTTWLHTSSVRYLLPSAVTLSALSCGVSAVRAATLGSFDLAVLFLCLAALFDGLDGHVARLLNAVTEMGAELDSLCDLVDFGVAPCLVVYTWLRYTTPEGAKTSVPDEVVWLSCLVFVCCCAFRLARFNLTDANAPKAIVEAVKSGEIGEDAVDDDDADAAAAKEEEPVPVPVAKKDSLHKRIGRSVVNRVSKSSASRRGMKLINDYITKKKFFQGVPAPMAGALALTPMVFSFQYGAYLPDPHLTVVATMLTVGGLMVSTLPTLSSKMLMRNPRKESHLKSRSIFSLLFKVAFVGAVIFAVVTVPWYFYLVCSLLYVIILPVSPFIHYLSE